MEKNFIKNITCFGATTIGERGQVVIPAEIRKKLKVKSGDKFVAFLSPVGTIMLIPSDQLGKAISVLNKHLTKLTRLTK